MGLASPDQDDQAPPLRETYYKSLFGEELWQKPNLEVLKLHNIPDGVWLHNATAAVSRTWASGPGDQRTMTNTYRCLCFVARHRLQAGRTP